jgi:hypothetical protein
MCQENSVLNFLLRVAGSREEELVLARRLQMVNSSE